MVVLSDIRKLLSSELGVPESDILENKTFSDLGADSLDFFQAIFAIQEHFDIELTDAELSSIETFNDLNTLISQRLADRVQT